MAVASHLAAGWEREPLGEVCALIKRGIAPKYVDEGGIRVVNQKCVRNHQVDYSLARRNDTNLKRVPDERLIQFGDVLVNSTGTGTLGRVAQVLEELIEPTTVDTHVTIVRPKKDRFYLPFFGYVMIAIETELEAAGHGAVGQTELPRIDVAEKFFATFPRSLEEQKRIVAVLDQAFAALDRARCLAEANLADVDELAWESTRRKLLPPASSEDWRRVSLGECIDVLSGFAFRSANYVDDGHFLIRIANVQDGKVSLQRPQFVALDEKTIRFELSAGDILTSLTGNIGRVAVVEERHLPAALNQRVAKLLPKSHSPITRTYLLHFLKSELFGQPLREKGHGTAQLNVSPKEIKKLEVWYPPRECQEDITDTIDRIEGGHRVLRENYLATVRDLEELRQSLLQKAFAGELT